jgi:AcrR family transcriptional regulator
MPGIVRKVVRSVKRHFATRRQQQRTWSFYDAGERLLAVSDHEQMTVTQLCREAGSSIGTFYNRFRDKDRFLYFLISAKFRAATDAAERELRDSASRKTSTRDLVRKIVEHVARRMGGSRTVGVTRAALKLGSAKPLNLDPLAKYRAAVSDYAVRLLAHRLSVSNPELAVRAGVQVVFATLIDATMHNHGPLRAGRDATADALTDLMERCLEIETRQWRGWPRTPDQSVPAVDSQGKAITADGDNDQGGLIAVMDPDLGVQVGAQRASREPRREHQLRYREISSPMKVNPTEISPRVSEESSEDTVSTEPGKRRHRWI